MTNALSTAPFPADWNKKADTVEQQQPPPPEEKKENPPTAAARSAPKNYVEIEVPSGFAATMEGDAISVPGTNKRKKAASAVPTRGRAKNIKGVKCYLEDRCDKPIVVSLEREYYEEEETEQMLISERSDSDYCHTDNVIKKSESSNKRILFPVNATTVRENMEDAFKYLYVSDRELACRQAITEVARPWLKDNRTTMTGYAYSSLFDVSAVSHLDMCKFEDLFRWDESTGKFSAIGQRFNSSMKHVTAFELFILNSTDKCILPHTGEQELRESVASSSSVNPQRAVIDSLSKSMNKGATFVSNVQFVREYIKRLRGMRNTHPIDMDHLNEMERAFSIFNDKENISAKEAEKVLHCHLDHLVQ
ncbi:hypothetical protein Pcinc_004263 [Petrolisthes cinctipes]|uniref:Uncharacterized protein n=1 Tax=Petrolisthes cinctipes TaxID=88211 RepID=A0AAE1L3V3_PETCI|nr:hypothetical protein Pcinc_004263 [Petrolisthes cinctipes]